MINNVWVHNEFRKVFEGAFKKRRLDLIPAICNGSEGCCMVSMSIEEVKRVLSAISRGVVIDVTGNKTAKIKGTEITINVNSMDKI